jgi:hypothetical protein
VLKPVFCSVAPETQVFRHSAAVLPYQGKTAKHPKKRMAYNTRDPGFCREAREASGGLQQRLVDLRRVELASTGAASGQNALEWTVSNEAGGRRWGAPFRYA